MVIRIAAFAALALSLCACSSIEEALSFPDAPPPAPVAEAAPAPAVAAPADDWCQRIAASDRAVAAANGFDAATQDRMTLRGFQQCAALAQR